MTPELRIPKKYERDPLSYLTGWFQPEFSGDKQKQSKARRKAREFLAGRVR